MEIINVLMTWIDLDKTPESGEYWQTTEHMEIYI